jgi:cellulose synthase/poly-beta-1,6-N-acetylglucosamine synthase-like glycosyltransferase
MIVSLSIIAALYITLIGVLYVAYQKVKPFTLVINKPKNQFTIIIPFRNEAKNLEALLSSIDSINYPKSLYEIILVDDDSNDNSVDIIKGFKTEKFANLSIIKNNRQSNSPKKDAIQTAISHAKFEWIITTDADCTVPSLWLQTFDSFIQLKSPKLIVPPVTYQASNSFLDNFQLHDFLSLQTATVGGFGINNPFLCNGANLCYAKSAFIELNGFDGNNHIVSGDDLFFLEKVKRAYPNDVHYLKSSDAIVSTKPEPTIKTLFYQRVRWASKTSAYDNLFSKILAFSVLLMNASIIVTLVFVLIGLLSWQILMVLFACKFSADFFFIWKSSNFYKQNHSLMFYPFSSMIYPFFVVSVSVYSMFFKYKWKGRSFNK